MQKTCTTQTCLVIGNGWVANNRHKPALKKLGFQVITYDINDESFPQLLSQPDFAVIATPPTSRYEAIANCIAQGIRVFYIEKPLAVNPGEARNIKKLLEDNECSARCTHNFLFSDIGNEIYMNVVNPKNVILIQTNRTDRKYPSWIDSLPFGLGLDEFPHLAYLSRYIFPSDGILSKEASFIESVDSPSNRWEIQILCDKGWFIGDLWTDTFMWYNADQQYSYWQYHQMASRLSSMSQSLSRRILQRLVGKSNDFGTLKMWKYYLGSEKIPALDSLLSIDSGIIILDDYYRLRQK